MSDFVVRIDTTKLTDKQAAAVSAAIQGAVLSELGHLDLSPTGPTGSINFHPEWRGLWLRNLKEFQDLKQQVLTVQAR